MSEESPSITRTAEELGGVSWAYVEPVISEPVEGKRDWLPYILGAGGWIAAIVAILVR